MALAAALLPAVAQHTGHTPPAPPKPASPAAPLSLTVRGARVVAVPPGVTETSAFMTLKNTGAAPVVLTRAMGEVAGSAMLMSTRRDAKGLTGMRMVPTLTVPGRGTLTLSESGDHVMLMDLKRPLKVGETLRLRLETLDGHRLNVQAVVRKP